MYTNRALVSLTLKLILALQIAPNIVNATINNLQINLGNDQELSPYYTLGDKESLSLYNGYSKPILNIKIIDYFSGKPIMSIEEIRQNQSTNITFSKGIYIIHFNLTNYTGRSVIKEFQIKVDHQNVI